MKKSLWIVLFISALAMSSCLSSKYMTTPAIGLDPEIVVNGTDTIGIFINSEEKAYSIDTVQVGDSVAVNVVFDAVGNELTKAYIGFKSEYMDVVIDDSNLVDGDIITRTDAQNSITYDVVLGYRAIILKVIYVPKKAGMGKLEFRVESNSEYSPTSMSLLVPIVENQDVDNVEEIKE